METNSNKLVTLKKNKEFTFLYHKGKSLARGSIVAIYHINRYGGYRFGYSVSKKVGHAVVRNKIHRRLKEATRLAIADGLKARHISIVFVARSSIVNCSFLQLTEDVKSILNGIK